MIHFMGVHVSRADEWASGIVREKCRHDEIAARARRRRKKGRVVASNQSTTTHARTLSSIQWWTKNTAADRQTTPRRVVASRRERGSRPAHSSQCCGLASVRLRSLTGGCSVGKRRRVVASNQRCRRAADRITEHTYFTVLRPPRSALGARAGVVYRTGRVVTSGRN